MLFSTFGANLFVNILVSKGVIRAGNGVHRAGQDKITKIIFVLNMFLKKSKIYYQKKYHNKYPRNTGLLDNLWIF